MCIKLKNKKTIKDDAGCQAKLDCSMMAKLVGNCWLVSCMVNSSGGGGK